MLSNAAGVDIDRVFEGLSNNKRRAILDTLSFRPATVSQLAQEHCISLASIHRHIHTLEDAKLIRRRKVGRVNFVALQRESLAAAKTWIMRFDLEWGHDEETLDNYITSLNGLK